MQLLKLPTTFEDMTASVSMTGITILKDGKYKQRHGGPKEIIESYPGELITKQEYKLRYKGKEPDKRRPPKNVSLAPAIQKKVSMPRNYKINKKEVTHRIRGYVNQMAGEKQLYFWTVTFPLGTSDDTAFILLNKWLTRLRKEKLLKSYLWITERQQNNTIHFHIAINNRVCVKKANRFMRAAIFTCVDAGEIPYSRIDAKNYNGVDIAKDRKTKRVTNFAKQSKAKNLVNYLTKYISKNNGTFTHLAWHSSRDYSNLIISVRITSAEYDSSGVKQFICTEHIFENDWIRFYKWKGHPPDELLSYLKYVNQLAMSLFPQS